MKRKETDGKIKVSGYYVSDFIRGFFGNQNEGGEMLKKMGLPVETVPFSVAVFLQNQKVQWADIDGNTVSISFVLKQDQLECFGSYLGKKKSIRLFREWCEYDNQETVSMLESEAIGDLCAKCIYENLK